MSWKQAAGLIIVIFTLALLQSVAAPAIFEVEEGINQSGDYSNEHFDGNALITDTFSSWWDMGLVAIFLLMGVALARAVRRELNKLRREP